jgi:hypothetical protein
MKSEPNEQALRLVWELYLSKGFLFSENGLISLGKMGSQTSPKW